MAATFALLRHAGALALRQNCTSVLCKQTLNVTRSQQATPWFGIGRQTRLFSRQSHHPMARSFGAPARTAARTGVAPHAVSNRTQKLAVSAAAALGVAGLGFYGAKVATEAVTGAGAVSADAFWPEYVRKRVNSTFVAFGTGLVFTAASTVVLFRFGAAHMMARRPMVAMIGGLAGTIGTMMLTMSISPDNVVAKYGSMALFNSMIGLTLCPIVALGGPLLLQAAAITGGIVGSLSFIAANSPSDKFLFMAGPLSMGLGAVIIASLGAAFFPAAGVAPLLHNVSLYGGTALFSAFVLYDTSKLVTHAKSKPKWDPVNESLGIYMDTVNIFIRIATMLSGNRKK